MFGKGLRLEANTGYKKAVKSLTWIKLITKTLKRSDKALQGLFTSSFHITYSHA